MTTLDLVICTYRREQLLEKALASLAAQAAQPGLSVRVLVVDNSDEESARPIVTAMQPGYPFALVYLTAHPANISVARNAGVAASEADFVGFLDDDQTLAPGWMMAVAEAVTRLPHDGFFGAVAPDFESPERATPMTRQLFSRRLDAPMGTALIAMGPAKTRSLALATNNSIFRRAIMTYDGAPFDAAFGRAGGEDYDLICRLEARGGRFAWLPQAMAHEFVPASRCDASYLRRRFYAGGQAFAAAVAKASATPKRTRWLIRLKAVAQLLLMLPRLPFKRAQGGAAWADYGFVLAGILGKLSFGSLHPIYGAVAQKPEQPVARKGVSDTLA